ncbi:dihydrolipoamide acetyltransferase family protein [Levilinea saccharolytica]|uniref:Dihydrolipoamide acetyltransferase component of pyruvate dehydrogenase complex n=1 Tax=Levilinea saccharolytica TaxID=229921 RepID=A0A0M8JPQ0_9CHLR|nr:dihydrolipoamide acetyltransferase family protein [Levilinea saccharolytica]KPL76228.1 hypothetical protein ADN01_16905 [Levilinea saccharolytica]GAP19002.1 pyruvate/2-oxoglutarate dehydrogenase complex, dihydrolipoamide acyltransferase (E2) component [Levilinea saccharolytica]
MAEIVSMPKLGFDMAEGTLVRWVKNEGDTIAKGDVLAEIETDKATVEVESSFSGVVARHLVEAGAIVPVGTPIAVIGAEGEEVKDVPGLSGTPEKAVAPAAAAPAPAAPAASQPAAAAPVSSGPVVASPLARRIAADNGLDLAAVRGTGPGGRIVKRDVEAALKAGPAAVSALAAPAATIPAAVPAAAARADEVVGLDRLRVAIGRRMTESKQQLPHFYVTHEYDMEALLGLRKQVNALLPEEDKLSVNDFIVKAVGLCLRRFPNLNASLKEGQLVRHGAVNVGVAVAVEGGLLTIVTRATDAKPLRTLSGEIRDLVSRARSGKVRPDDIEGSTFSISNLGMYDVEHFIAIINPPEAAILAVGSAREVPVVKDGQVTVGLRMKATLSADHRVTDGAEAAQFMQALADYLEQPLRLLVE